MSSDAEQSVAEVLEQAETLFATKRGPKGADGPADTERLYSEIGRLKVELDWLKKKPVSCDREREMVELGGSELFVARQCELLGLPR